MYYPTEGSLWASSVTQHEKGKYNHKIPQARGFQQRKRTFTSLKQCIDPVLFGNGPSRLYLREASANKTRWQKGLLD